MAKEKKEKKEKGLSSRFVVTIAIILLFGVFVGFGFAIGGVKILNSNCNNVVTKTAADKVDTKDSAQYTDIPLDNMIQSLYERTKAVSFGIDRTRYANKKLLVSEMSDEYKGLIAANYFMRFDDFHSFDVSHHLKESDVRYAYESLFGVNSYTSGQTIYTGCGNYTYNVEKREYVTNQDGCGGTSAQVAFEKTIKAEKSIDGLKITTGVIFATPEGYFKSYEDMDDPSKAFNYTGVPNGEDEYILSNRNNVQQITYTFEVDKNGFYKYVGFERTQEAK